MSNKPLSHTEKMYLENEEFNKKNQEEVIIPKAPNWKAIAFRKENGYSRTMGKLMEKYNCKTVEEYRVIRKKHQKEGNIGPKKEKKVVETVSNNRNGYNANYKNNNKNNVSKNKR